MKQDEIEAIENLAGALYAIAKAIEGTGSPGPDAAGGIVGSLTEAVMGNTAALMAISDSIHEAGQAVYMGNELIAEAITEAVEKMA